MKYYVVYSELNKSPEAIFRIKKWASRFIENQRSIWLDTKFKIKEIDLPTIRRKKLKIVHKIIWIDYVLHGINLLTVSIKNYAQERYTRIFSKSQRRIRG